jgi:hypothetical protein
MLVLYFTTMLEDLAERADRAMRTYNARNIAESAYALVRDALLSAEGGDAETRVCRALVERNGWRRRNERDFICMFGDRSAVLTVPRPFDSRQMAQLITRVEVNVCLGRDAAHSMLRELQSLAQRELERLRDADRPQ